MRPSGDAQPSPVPSADGGLAAEAALQQQCDILRKALEDTIQWLESAEDKAGQPTPPLTALMSHLQDLRWATLCSGPPGAASEAVPDAVGGDEEDTGLGNRLLDGLMAPSSVDALDSQAVRDLRESLHKFYRPSYPSPTEAIGMKEWTLALPQLTKAAFKRRDTDTAAYHFTHDDMHKRADQDKWPTQKLATWLSKNQGTIPNAAYVLERLSSDIASATSGGGPDPLRGLTMLLQMDPHEACDGVIAAFVYTYEVNRWKNKEEKKVKWFPQVYGVVNCAMREYGLKEVRERLGATRRSCHERTLELFRPFIHRLDRFLEPGLDNPTAGNRHGPFRL